MNEKVYTLGLALWLLAALLLQTTVLPHLRIKGVYPNPILVFVVIFGLLKGPKQGAILGFFSGLLLDILGLRVVGVNLLLKTTIGFLAGFIERRFYKENILVPVVAVLLATVINEAALFMVVGFLEIFSGGFEFYFQLVLPLAVYNMLITLPIFFLFCCYDRALEEKSAL